MSNKPKPLTFSGPYLKIERAKQHIDNLKKIFWAHIKANEDAVLPQGRNQAGLPASPIGTPLPPHTPTILGDALHNLRASLDHAYCILVQANGGTINEHVRFPFHANGSRQSLEGSINGHAKNGNAPSQTVIEYIIDVIQPYKGGKGTDLIALHTLDIADKHMILLPTEVGNTVNVQATHGGGIRGITIINEGHVGNAISFGPGVGVDYRANNNVSINICFGRGQPFEGQPMVPILEKLYGRVVETLKNLENFI